MDLASQQIGRYEIRGLLGKGAMGSVLRAWDPKLHREVAIKVVAKNAQTTQKARERFQREARAIAALRHPNIVEIYDYSGEDSDTLYLVMEKLEGADLFNLMSSHGAFPEAVAAAVGYELCMALQTAHDAGIIHRDLKPENVFLDATGRVVLTDFGVVKVVRRDSEIDSFRVDTDIIGTPGFMAPELVMSKELGPATDIFSLGSLLYNLATNEMPFAGAGPLQVHKAIMNREYMDPRQYAPLLSEDFCALLARTMEPQASLRPASANQVRESLKKILHERGVVDWQEDLRQYVNDPRAYATWALQREAKHLQTEIKLAAQTSTEEVVLRMQHRLSRISPTEGSDVGIPADRLTVRRNSPGPAWWLAGIAVAGGAGAWWWWSQRKHDLPPTQPSVVAAPNAPVAGPTSKAASNAPTETKPSPTVPATGVLSFRVKGGAAQVLINGRAVDESKPMTVPPGKILIEAVTKKKRVAATRDIQAGSRTQVDVEVRGGKPTLRFR